MESFAELIRHTRFLPFAHRGASQLAPENTFAAFQIAHDLGFKIIETDIRSSSDGVLYCFHDQSVKRMTGSLGNIENLPSQHIDELRINWTHSIPKLENLYEAFPNAYFNIDAKSWNCVDPLVDLVRRTNTSKRTCFGSFDQARLDRITSKLMHETLAHSLGTRGVISLYLGYLTGKSRTIQADCAQLPLSHLGINLVNKQTLAYFQSLGLKIHVWTINKASEFQRLIDLGVDGIMTDDCELLKYVLEKNNLWL
jgi:glycerophosphoryl diester phosphodiesterase